MNYDHVVFIGIFSMIVGYLLGSIPTALIMSRLRKEVDIRQVGSNNMGAANVVREIGMWEGIVVGAIDITKGAVATIIPKLLGLDILWVMAAGFCAILGHNYPLFASFKGGKGSATLIGIFLLLSPLAILASVAIIIIPLFTTRNFAFAISISFILLPLFIFILGYSISVVLYALFIDFYMLFTNIVQVQQTVKTIFIKK
jgi:glycerol-3-phosphate acyltransferase PlsY